MGEVKTFKTLKIEPMKVNSVTHDNDYHYITSDSGVGYIHYNQRINISGDTSKFYNCESCGIYIQDNITNKKYKIIENLSGSYNNTEIVFELEIPSLNYETIDYANYSAKTSRYSFGIYAEYSDGSAYLTETKSCTYVYNTKPSFKFINVGNLDVSVINIDEENEVIEYKAGCSLYSEVQGVFWIEHCQAWVDGGDWHFITTGEKYGSIWYPQEDRTFDEYITINYYSDFSGKDLRIDHIEWQTITTKNNETLNSNYLIWGGAPENPFVYISNTAGNYQQAFRSMDSHNQKKYYTNSSIVLESTQENTANSIAIDKLPLLVIP